MNDLYPTRKSNEFKTLSRQEPTVWGSVSGLAKELADFYAENGYLILRGWLNREAVEIARMLSCDIFDGEAEAFINYEPDGKQVRSALSVHHYKDFQRLLTKSVTDLVSDILGSDIYMYQSRINYKAGREANGWNWHSDFETWHSKDGLPSMRCLSVMIPLESNTEDNGCLKVIPETHRIFISCPKVGDLDPNAEFSEQVEGVPSPELIDELVTGYGVVSIICNPGDVVLFDCNILHGSARNTTTSRRTNLYFVLNSTENKLVDPFAGTPHRPDAMAEMNYTPIN